MLVSVSEEGMERCDLLIRLVIEAGFITSNKGRVEGGRRPDWESCLVWNLEVRLCKIEQSHKDRWLHSSVLLVQWCNHYFFCSFLFWIPCVIQWPLLLSPVWTAVHPLSLSPLSSPQWCHLCSARRRNFDVKVGSITTSLTTSVVCESVGVLGCLQSCVGVKYELLGAVMFMH